jgi:Fimbrial assembly protein (PilN)
MHELDLIPASYKERLKIKRWCRQFGLAFASVLVILFSLKFAIVNKTAVLTSKIEVLQKDKQTSIEHQQNYNELVTKEVKLRKELEILNGLRGGPSAKQILLAVDRVMQDDVWFTQWSYNRAGEITQVQPATVQTGYFIIIPQEANGSPNQQAWKLNTHMEINGQALNHSSLSGFIRNLIKQPEIEDVKVINTSLHSYISSQVVEFNLVVIINNQFKDDHV